MLQETNITKFIGCIIQSEEIITALFDEKAISKNKKGYYDINTAVLDFFSDEPKIENIKNSLKSTEKHLDIVSVQNDIRNNLYSLHPDYQVIYIFDMLRKIPLHLFYTRTSFIDPKSEILGIQDDQYFNILGTPYGDTTISLFKQVKQKPLNQLNDVEHYLSIIISNVKAFVYSIRGFCTLFNISTEEINSMLTYMVFDIIDNPIETETDTDIISRFIPGIIDKRHKKSIQSFISSGKADTTIPIKGTTKALVLLIFQLLEKKELNINGTSIYKLIMDNFTNRGKKIPRQTISDTLNSPNWNKYY